MPLVIDVAPSPPSAPGITQPILLGAPPPTFPEFTPLFPPPNLGSGTPAFPPGQWTPPPLPSFTVLAAVGPDSGPIYLPLNNLGTNPIVWPDFSTTFPFPAVTFANTFMNWGPPPMVATTQNVF